MRRQQRRRAPARSPRLAVLHEQRQPVGVDQHRDVLCSTASSRSAAIRLVPAPDRRPTPGLGRISQARLRHQHLGCRASTPDDTDGSPRNRTAPRPNRNAAPTARTAAPDTSVSPRRCRPASPILVRLPRRSRQQRRDVLGFQRFENRLALGAPATAPAHIDKTILTDPPGARIDQQPRLPSRT